MSTSERDSLLVSINEGLARRNLRPLHKLGDVTKGEIELGTIIEIYDHSVRFFTDIKFEAKIPTPKGVMNGAFTLRFNANGAVSDGAVIVPVINNRFAIVKQWRPALGRYTYEFPCGFGEALDKATVAGALGQIKIGELPLGTLWRELGEEVQQAAEVVSVTHLGNIAQNTGTDCVIPAHYLVLLRAPEEMLTGHLTGEENLMVQLWDKARVQEEIGRRLADNHTLAALTLVFNHMDRLPRN